MQLVGPENTYWKKKYKLANGARLVLLRRTLRSNPQAAAIVRSLKVPRQPIEVSPEHYQSLVASVVMACPNLERLVGLYPPYKGVYNRLIHSLSTRPRLKQMDWIVEPGPVQRHRRSHSISLLSKKAGSLVMSVTEKQPPNLFFENHSNWAYLSHLSIHCKPGAVLPVDALGSYFFSGMPALRHLYLSNLPYSVCNDATLMNLPPLHTLSLSKLPGITTVGMTTIMACSSFKHIESLTLRHMDLSSLQILARLFAKLNKLRTFNIVQNNAPALPEGEVIWLFPYLASKTLHSLHWDIASSRLASAVSEGDNILARSIAANGFPSLRSIRVPNDGEGIFQALCKPRARIDLPTDRLRLRLHRQKSQTSLSLEDAPTALSSVQPSFSSLSSMNSLKKTNISSPLPNLMEAMEQGGTDLVAARIAAQSRLEAALRVPKFHVNILDEDGSVNETFGIGGHIGTVSSKVRYNLLPEDGASDMNGGLVNVTDILGGCGEVLTCQLGSTIEGCTGKWNTWSGNLMRADRKERERWYHTERGRWRPVQLS